MMRSQRIIFAPKRFPHKGRVLPPHEFEGVMLELPGSSQVLIHMFELHQLVELLNHEL